MCNVVAYDGEVYEVQECPLKQDCADRLASIKKGLDSIVDYCVFNKLPSQSDSIMLKERWEQCTIKEMNYFNSEVAFVVNKGSEFRLCLKRKDREQLDEYNTSIHVCIHELAHLLSHGYGHGDEFKKNFDFLTLAGIKVGAYTPEDFVKNPKKYCGFLINHSPCDDGRCTLQD